MGKLYEIKLELIVTEQHREPKCFQIRYNVIQT